MDIFQKQFIKRTHSNNNNLQVLMLKVLQFTRKVKSKTERFCDPGRKYVKPLTTAISYHCRNVQLNYQFTVSISTLLLADMLKNINPKIKKLNWAINNSSALFRAPWVKSIIFSGFSSCTKFPKRLCLTLTAVNWDLIQMQSFWPFCTSLLS